jgi:hypothetical protein
MPRAVGAPTGGAAVPFIAPYRKEVAGTRPCRWTGW